MSDPINTTREIVISCLHGLGEYLKDEVESLGYKVRSFTRSSVTTDGTLKDTYFMNLWLRTASHVYFHMGSSRIKNAKQLYAWIKGLNWEEWIKEDGYFSVQSYVKNKSINDNRFANLTLKDAMVDRFQEVKGMRPDSGPDTSQAVVYLHWVEESASVYLDTSGATLTKRGYRQIPGAAPMSESLAAAVILSSGWNKDAPFINPMCGSGTLAIEAALIAGNIAPGSYRYNFAFKHYIPFDAVHWKHLLSDLKKPRDLTFDFPIIVSDLRRRAVSDAKQNAAKAGVDHLMEFNMGDFRKTMIPDTPGVIIMNPPYGNRLGEEDELIDLYKSMGDFFKNNCINYKGYVFTGNRELAKFLGLRTTSKKIFFNAKLECRLLEYEIFKGNAN